MGKVLTEHFHVVGIRWQFTTKLVLGLPRLYGHVLNSWARGAPDS